MQPETPDVERLAICFAARKGRAASKVDLAGGGD